jgi:3-deoxy-D-manno-octulosonic acid kinase
MPLDNNIKVSKVGRSYVLYDASIIDEPVLPLFNRDYHTNTGSQQNKSVSPTGEQASGGIGRAMVTYFALGDKSYVLKHYYRGGLVASILKDRYLGFSVLKSRAFREFRLLKKMQQSGLPVPVAVAAHACKGLFSYRADLITEELLQAATLADVLTMIKLGEEAWQGIGRCIRRFHQHDVYHADLNARNILLTEQAGAGKAGIYLIDFDNSYIRLGSNSWKVANLSRLKRSLLKFKNKTDGFNFDEKNWESLLAGYKADVV